MKCYLCGRNGAADPLDRHHIFNGAYRKKSEKYGLVVPLCHYRCHEVGKYAAHNNPDTALYLKHKGQVKVMKEQGWDTKRFIKEFGKDYTAIYLSTLEENNDAEQDYFDGPAD